MTPTSKPLLVRVLGPVDVVIAGTIVPITTRLGRKLLAALTVSANHMVPAGVITRVLWGDRPPASQDNTLQTYVSRLRHLLGADRIETEDHSYLLRVDVDEVDALIFEAGAAASAAIRSQPEPCLAECKQALGWWRGLPFGEFGEADPFRLEAIRLDELRLFVMELQIESQIELGRPGLVVGALEALVEEYPLRERFWSLLMVALALTGRRVEALRAGFELRKLLGEAGLEPVEEIGRLEDAILTGRPAGCELLLARSAMSPRD